LIGKTSGQWPEQSRATPIEAWLFSFRRFLTVHSSWLDYGFPGARRLVRFAGVGGDDVLERGGRRGTAHGVFLVAWQWSDTPGLAGKEMNVPVFHVDAFADRPSPESRNAFVIF